MIIGQQSRISDSLSKMTASTPHDSASSPTYAIVHQSPSARTVVLRSKLPMQSFVRNVALKLAELLEPGDYPGLSNA